MEAVAKWETSRFMTVHLEHRCLSSGTLEVPFASSRHMGRGWTWDTEVHFHRVKHRHSWLANMGTRITPLFASEVGFRAEAGFDRERFSVGQNQHLSGSADAILGLIIIFY